MALLDELLRIVAPQKCVACLRYGHEICEQCYTRLSATQAVYRRPLPGIPAITALGAYKDELREAVLGLKFRGRQGAALLLGEMLARKLVIRPEVILPVPLDRLRLRERGYNQAEGIALGVGRATGGQVLIDVLRRVKKTAPQSSLRRKDRARNVASAFAAGADAGAVVRKNVLLVDDVVTSGLTVAACTRVLTEAGARSVEVAAVALKV